MTDSRLESQCIVADDRLGSELIMIEEAAGSHDEAEDVWSLDTREAPVLSMSHDGIIKPAFSAEETRGLFANDLEGVKTELEAAGRKLDAAMQQLYNHEQLQEMQDYREQYAAFRKGAAHGCT